eukprot:gene60635-80862_t
MSRPFDICVRGAGIVGRAMALQLASKRLRVALVDTRARILAYSPTGKVPLLVHDDVLVWDTLAIAEYVAEQFPEKQLWPADRAARARARSICAEMHSGFGALRSACPMNIEAHLPALGQLIWRDKPAVRLDVARL